MNTEYIARLVKMADNLFYKKTRLHLKDMEKNILAQILIGKKSDDIQAGEISIETLKKHWITNLWKRLSIALGKKILKINVLGELQKLHKEQRRIITYKLSIDRRSRLTKNTYVKGLSGFKVRKSSASNLITVFLSLIIKTLALFVVMVQRPKSSNYLPLLMLENKKLRMDLQYKHMIGFLPLTK